MDGIEVMAVIFSKRLGITVGTFVMIYNMMPGSKGQKAVHACMIRLLNLGPAKHEEGVICVTNQRIPNVCRIAGATCCGAIRGHQLGAKDLLTPTSYYIIHT